MSVVVGFCLMIGKPRYFPRIYEASILKGVEHMVLVYVVEFLEWMIWIWNVSPFVQSWCRNIEDLGGVTIVLIVSSSKHQGS